MIKLMKLIGKLNKKVANPITEPEIKLALIVNHSLLIKKYERYQRKVK